MKQDLKDQIEKILDSEPNKRLYSVIVQMQPPAKERRSLLQASTEAMRRRYLTISPRELAPPKAELLRSTISRRDRQQLRASNSMTSQMALSVVPSLQLEDLRAEGLTALQPLRDTELVRTRASRIRDNQRKLGRRRERATFRPSWSSRSALLTLGRDDLPQLPDSVEGIGGVYANGTISVPPVVEVKDASAEELSTIASTWGIERIGALAVWGAYNTRGNSPNNSQPVRVAVLDTGVDAAHPELLDKVVEWAEFDDDGAKVDSEPHDSGKHGTHVCGTIAGGSTTSPSSASPLIGVAPDAHLMVGLVLNGTTGTHAQILAGIDWAIENGADIINMSLGGVHLQPDVIDLYTQSIITANLNGIPVVVAIGNEGAQTSGLPGNDYFAFSVGATDHRDRAAGFSGGRTQVVHASRYIPPENLPLYYSKPEVTAPGVAIRSCTPRDGYETWNGTSMAAPHVSGALALLLAATNIRSVSAARRAYLLQDLLISSVEELGEAGRDHRFGFGRINALRAVAMATDLGY